MAMTKDEFTTVSEAIGELFSPKEVNDIVLAATGHHLYKEYAGPNDPLNIAIHRALERLADVGAERWLLIQVLASRGATEELQRLVGTTLPKTLAELPKVDDLVDRAQKSLASVTAMVPSPAFMFELKSSREHISEQIRALAAYKNLHECLHALHISLAFRSAAADDLVWLTKIKETCGKARTAAEALGKDAEKNWITALERSSAEIGTAITAADSAATEIGFGQAQRVVRLWLSHLNRQIFEAADTLSLDSILVVSSEIRGQATFEGLVTAIRDLKATMMARALVHKIWQDAENEFSLIEALLNMPAKSALSLIRQHWILLRSRVSWLAPVDRDPALKLKAEEFSNRIDTEIFKETLSDAMKIALAEFYRLLVLHFFKVDAELKEDCKSLEKFDRPLNPTIKEIGNARSFEPRPASDGG
jgi:hypothetical protein